MRADPSTRTMPVTGPPLQVRNRDDDRFGRPQDVDDLIGEARHQHSQGVPLIGKSRADSRVGLDSRNRPLDSFKERGTQSAALAFVPSDSLAQFLAGGSAETDVR